MKKIVLAACLAAFALVTGSVMAQPQSNTPGSAEEQMNKPKGTKGAATKEEKAAAKSARKAEGKAAVKESAAPTGTEKESAGVAKKATKAERKAAAAHRKEAGKAPAKVGAGAAEEKSQQQK